MKILTKFWAVGALVLGLSNAAQAWTLAEKLGFKEVEEYVTIGVSAHPALCEDPEFPIYVQIQNNYNETIEYTKFTYFGKIPGRSSKIYGVLTNRVSTDVILNPQEVYEGCWSIPNKSLPSVQRALVENPPSTVDWFGEIIYVIVTE